MQLRKKYPLKCPDCGALDSMVRVPYPNNLHTVTGCTHSYGCKTYRCSTEFQIWQPVCKNLATVEMDEIAQMGLLPARVDWSMFDE